MQRIEGLPPAIDETRGSLDPCLAIASAVSAAIAPAGHRALDPMSGAKQSADELAQRNALLEATFEAMGEAICLLDLDHRLISWNRRYVELRGVPPHLTRRGTDIRDVLRWQAERGDFGPGNLDEIVEREFHAAWDILPSRQRLSLASGCVLDVQRYALESLGYVTIAEEVTEQARAQAALQESRSRFGDFVDVSTDWVWEMDPDLRFSYMSEQVTSIVGVSPEWFLGKRREDIGVPEEDAARWADHLARLRDHLPFRDFELQVRLPTGQRRWITTSGKPIFDDHGRFLGYRGIGRDIGETKRRQDALRRSEQRLAVHIENTPVGVIEWNTDLMITAWNRAAERMFGYAANEAIGRSGLDLVQPAAREKVTRGLRRLLSGQGSRRGTNANIAKDGRRLICEWTHTPLVDDDGQIIGGASLVQDVTDRIATEAMLRDAKEHAEQMSRAKSEFLATMSHELRTPLNAIIGFSELIMTQTFGPVSPRYVDYARDIHASGTHLLDIINDILDLSKIEAGKLELADEAIELPRLVESTLRLMQGRASQGNLRLASEVASNLPDLRADLRALKQILINLLSNAIKFTPSGGRVTLSVALAPDGGVNMAIADTGIGMNPADIPRALEPFAQIESSLSRRFEGTGLGLPLCKRLVELHDATLHLTSAPGSGTTASVHFPPARSIGRQA